MGHYVIATDEAGYGPKLGPLVVAATTWELSSDSSPDEQLACVSEGVTASDGTHFPIADSKQLFQRGSHHALHRLEYPLFCAVLQATERKELPFPSNLGLLLKAWSSVDHKRLASTRWFSEIQSQSFPVSFDTHQELQQTKEVTVDTALSAFLDVSARTLEARYFNQQCEVFGNKANLLTDLSLQLVRAQMQLLSSERPEESLKFSVFCDRHGGRSHYAGPLQHVFPEAFPWIHGETAQLSRYQLETEYGTLDIQFRVKGDTFGPVALASIAAKYLRERLMDCFNQFWMNQVGDCLRPTAGYGTDAQRFRKEIHHAAERLGLPPGDYWRER